MKVDRALATPYATTILAYGRGLAKVIQPRVDLAEGAFEVTAAFKATSPNDWVITSEGAQQNRVTDAAHPRGWRSDFEERVRDWILPQLRVAGRALIVEGWNWYSRRWPPPEPGVRLWAVPEGAEEVNDHWVAPGPVDSAEPIRRAMGISPPHWTVGAVVDVSPADLPEHNALVTREEMASLIEDVVGLYMRMASYDGYLLWKKTGGDAPATPG